MKKRTLLPNVILEEKFMGGIRKRDFWKFVFPIFLLSLIPNLILITVYSKYDLFAISAGFLATGLSWLLLYEVEYCYRVIDIFAQYLNYLKKGDRLYEKFQKEE